MCNIDGMKSELLNDYQQEKLRRDSVANTDEDDDFYERNIIKDWCPQFVDPPGDTYNHDKGGRYRVEDYVSYLKLALPEVNDYEKLYDYYKG